MKGKVGMVGLFRTTVRGRGEMKCADLVGVMSTVHIHLHFVLSTRMFIDLIEDKRCPLLCDCICHLWKYS